MANGALTGLTGEETYPVHQTRTFSPDLAQGELQNVYGISMPSFQFVDTRQTGTRRYNPTDPKDQDFIERYDAAKKELEEKQGADPGLPSASEIILTGIIPTVAVQLVEEATYNMLNPYDPDLSLSERALEGVKWGDSPRQLYDTSIEAGYKLAPELRPKEFYAPALSSGELAGDLGQAAEYERLVDLGALDPKTGIVTSGTYQGQLGGEGPMMSMSVDPADYADSITQQKNTLSARGRRALDKFGDPNRLMATAAGAGIDLVGELAQGRSLKKAVKRAGTRAVLRHSINTFLPSEFRFLGNWAAALIA